jgi:hypothetical protein
VIIEETINANEAEVFWIEYFRSIGVNLTNGTVGGDGGKVTEDVALKISQALIGKPKSQAMKDKLSKSKLGILFTDEHKAKLGKHRIGSTMSDELRDKIYQANVKTYRITDPSGKEIVVTDLSKFAKDNNLTVQRLYQLASGTTRAKTHKGYKCVKC